MGTHMWPLLSPIYLESVNPRCLLAEAERKSDIVWQTFDQNCHRILNSTDTEAVVEMKDKTAA